MAGTPVPFSFSGSLNIAEGPGLPPDPIPIATSGQFTSLAQYVLNPSGSGSKTIDFGTVGSPGAKGVLVSVDDGTSVAPVTMTVNSSVTGGIEISKGGFVAVGSPTPVTGITSLTFTYTTACTIRIWVLG